MIVPLGKAHSRGQAYRQMAEMVAEAGGQRQGPRRLHARRRAARGGKDQGTGGSQVEVVESFFAELSPALAVHTGPGTAGLCYYPVEDEIDAGPIVSKRGETLEGGHMTDLAATHGPWADLACEGLLARRSGFHRSWESRSTGWPARAGERRWGRSGCASGPGHLTPFSERPHPAARQSASPTSAISRSATRPGTSRRCAQQDRGADQCAHRAGRRSFDHHPDLPGAAQALRAASGWGCCGWTRTRTCATSSTVRGSRMPACCGAGLEAGIEPRDVCLVGLRSWEEQEIELIENGHMHVFSAADVAELGMKLGGRRRAPGALALRGRAHLAGYRLPGPGGRARAPASLRRAG